MSTNLMDIPMIDGRILRLVWIGLALWCAAAAGQEEAIHPALMPAPAKVEWQLGKFRLTENFIIALAGQPHQRLYAGATRALRRLSGRTGLFLPQDFLRPGVAVASPDLVITCDRPGQVRFGEDESYTLVVTPTHVELAAPTDLGARHGLETLLQLLAADAEGYYFPAVRITDAPRFGWRGLMIDASRHFMPVAMVLRNLDGMAAMKMNVLHWHLSDDQGFRVESLVYPKLHELGSDGFYYTQAQIREVIAYAEARGIRVVPEFDVPGHATSWLAAYPELGSAPGPYAVERSWGIFFPVINPASDFTYKFLDKFFGEMAALFPDAFFHIGGDEIEHGARKAEHWDNNPEIQAFKKKHNLADNHALQAFFNNRLLKILTKHGKIMVGWDEILHEAMPKNVVIQSWRGRDSMVEAARKGYRSILSNGYYIDLIQPTAFHYRNDPLPADLPLQPEEARLILGGEATMWAEFVSPETVDSRIWPRTAAIAERLWSPQQVNDVEDMYRRLEIINLQLEEHGLTHETNYGMMLRRLARGADLTALRYFVDVVEPVKIYNRNRLRPHTSFAPLTRVVDAARPDAPVARRFRETVDRYLENPQTDPVRAHEVRSWLLLWKNNHAELLKIAAVSPILTEITSLSHDLSASAAIGLEALTLLQQGRKETTGWRADKLKILAQAREPRGQVELMVISALEKMVAAASEARREEL